MQRLDSPMRVAFNAVPLLSPLTGVGQYAKCVLKELESRADVQSLKFYGAGWSEKIRNESLPATVMAWKDRIKKLIPNAYVINRIVQESRFARGLREFKPHVYHDPSFLPFNFDGPIVNTVHDLSWIRYPGTHPADRVRAMNKYFEPALRRSTRIITDAEFVKQELIDVFGINPDIIHPVALGVDDLFRPRSAESTQPVLNGLALTHGQYLLAVGTLEPRKNLLAALEAYATLPRVIRDNFPLVLVGMKGWKTTALQRKINLMLESGQVRQLGYLTREDLAIVTAGATAMVYPSVYEGFGLPPLESMSCGVPVIASNVSSIPEVVGDSGFLLDPSDIHGLALSMRELIEDKNLRAKLSEKALFRSRTFSWGRCVNQTMDVYRAAIA